ncbi:recombinase family protein [Streptomyces sp. NPDC004609]|uniref:recombinase family protein n=1 Tax=Streptomyces sp. NPDC004609 TaxID=3364704 RepID=UPI0036782773
MVEQGIDISTREGRAMFGMLSVLAELQRELIVANTDDGLAAARARGRVGGRRPELTQRQLDQAQKMYDDGTHTAEEIAQAFQCPAPPSTGTSPPTMRAATAPVWPGPW